MWLGRSGVGEVGVARQKLGKGSGVLFGRSWLGEEPSLGLLLVPVQVVEETSHYWSVFLTGETDRRRYNQRQHTPHNVQCTCTVGIIIQHYPHVLYYH